MIARGTAGGREPVELFFAIDLVVHLLLNGTYIILIVIRTLHMYMYLMHFCLPIGEDFSSGR